MLTRAIFTTIDVPTNEDRHGNWQRRYLGSLEGLRHAVRYSVIRLEQLVDEDLKNLAVFGEEALDAMNRCGLGYRDLRKLRRLGDDDRLAIVHEVELDTGDKDAIVSLIDDMAAKHAGEKQALEKQLDDMAAKHAGEKQALEKQLADTRATNIVLGLFITLIVVTQGPRILQDVQHRMHSTQLQADVQ